MIFDAKRVLFLAAHTDDEMLAAGTLHRMVREGAELSVMAMGTCAVESDRKGSSGVSARWVIEHEWCKAMQLIGAKNYECLNFQPSSSIGAKWGQEIADSIYGKIEEYKPDLVFTLSSTDENPAHAVVGAQTERVARGRVPALVRVHCPWNYDAGRCNLYMELDGSDLECKRRVINCYQSQKWRYSYEEMLMSYAIADGLSVKVPAAERFELVRCVL